MKLIKGSNTKPELLLFRVLKSAKIRFRDHVKLHGINVDAVISKRIAVFVRFAVLAFARRGGAASYVTSLENATTSQSPAGPTPKTEA